MTPASTRARARRACARTTTATSRRCCSSTSGAVTLLAVLGDCNVTLALDSLDTTRELAAASIRRGGTALVVDRRLQAARRVARAQPGCAPLHLGQQRGGGGGSPRQARVDLALVPQRLASAVPRVEILDADGSFPATAGQPTPTTCRWSSNVGVSCERVWSHEYVLRSCLAGSPHTCRAAGPNVPPPRSLLRSSGRVAPSPARPSSPASSPLSRGGAARGRSPATGRPRPGPPPTAPS